MNQTKANVTNTESVATKIPEDWRDKIVVVMAPGPTRRGKPIGTAPTLSGDVDVSCHPPVVRSLTATIRSSIPPATMKLNNEIPNRKRICCPAREKTNRSTNPVTIADRKVLFLCGSSMFFVRPMKIGTLPTGLTTRKSAIVPLASSARRNITEVVSADMASPRGNVALGRSEAMSPFVLL